MMGVMSEEDKKWQRRSDARTLAEAEQIKADKERAAGATQGAAEILAEEAARLNGLAKVAGKSKAVSTPRGTEKTYPSHSTPVPVPTYGGRHTNAATRGRLI